MHVLSVLQNNKDRIIKIWDGDFVPILCMYQIFFCLFVFSERKDLLARVDSHAEAGAEGALCACSGAVGQGPSWLPVLGFGE